MIRYLKKFFLIFFVSILIIGILSSGVLLGGFLLVSNIVNSQFSGDLATTVRILNFKPEGYLIYDSEGKQIYKSPEARQIKYVTIDKIPDNLKNAAISIEDDRFYQHFGFDIYSIIRALYKNNQQDGIVEGGSTITQQLVRNSFLEFDQNYTRKIKEIMLAIQLERKYSKDQILEMYLNSIYFGSGAYGAENASGLYFNKHVQDLSLEEAALLAGLPKAPSELSPYVNIETAKNRRNLVLSKMYERGDINEESYKKASETEVVVVAKVAVDTRYPHFSLYVQDELMMLFEENDIQKLGLKIYTTLNPEMQDFAQTTLTEGVAKLNYRNANNGSVVQIDPKTGAIYTMVGSVGWNIQDVDGRINMAVTPRQPGSSIKPLIYGAALDAGYIAPNTVLHDVPTTFSPNYKPLDFDKKFRGSMMPRRALTNSLNIPAVEVISRMGYVNALDKLQEMGVTSISDYSNYGLSVVLGGVEIPPLEMAGAYTTLANGGMYAKPYAIEKVEDKYGQVLFERKVEKKQVISPETAYIITDWISDSRARSEIFGYPFVFNYGNTQVASKTGTTENFRDSWQIAYTPSILTAIWVGNSDNKEMRSITGADGAATIMHPLMLEAIKGKEDIKFVMPSTLTRVSICPIDGSLSCGNCGGQNELFVEGSKTIPTKYCSTDSIDKIREDFNNQYGEKKKEEEKKDDDDDD
jgi:1A family penicillin-binding protein